MLVISIKNYHTVIKWMIVALCALPICPRAFCDAGDSGGEEAQAAAPSFFWDGIGRVSGWGRPFWADMHSTLVRAEVAYATNSPEYDWAGGGSNERFFVFANLGADLPVWSSDFAGGRFGLSVTLPFMIDVWLDMFERTTAPVINTSYRFGAPEISFLHRLQKPLPVIDIEPAGGGPKSWWRNILTLYIYNYSLRLSPFKHECTHIGDELTIHRKDNNMQITRINVSYNYAELTFTINDPDGQKRLNHGFKFGMLMLHDFSKGYYDILSEEADPEAVEPTQIPFEWFIQYQFQTAQSRRGFQGIFSVEWRLRERYKYPFSYSGKWEEYLETYKDVVAGWKKHDLQFCYNVFAGIRYNNPRPSYFSKIGVGLRAYSGINPYGQFRSQIRFDQWGIILVFE